MSYGRQRGVKEDRRDAYADDVPPYEDSASERDVGAVTREGGTSESSCRCCKRAPVRVGWVDETWYEDLQGKPKINGVEISKDHDGHYYELANLEDVYNLLNVIGDATVDEINAKTGMEHGDAYILKTAGIVTNGYGGVPFKAKAEDIVFYTVFNTWKMISGKGVTSYNELEDRPKINDVLLEGNKTLAEIGVGDGKLTAKQNGVSLGEFTANTFDNKVFEVESPNWRESDPAAKSYVRNKPDWSGIHPINLSAFTLNELAERFNELLKAEKGGFDFSQVPRIEETDNQRKMRHAINMMLSIARPMGGMPPLMPMAGRDEHLVTESLMRSTFNEMKAALVGYDVSSVGDVTENDTTATFRGKYNELATILMSHL